MAPSALINNGQLEPLQVCTLYGMGSMAIVAHREWLIGFEIAGKMNAFCELFVDAIVAFGACLSDIGRVDARFRIDFGEFMMRSVAVGAHRSDHQTAFQKPFAMNALDITADNIMFVAPVSDGGFASLAMTFATQIGDMSRIGRR